MNLEKLNPWNWFKHENVSDADSGQVPVTREDAIVSPITGANSLMQLHREMDRLFDDVFNAFSLPSLRSPFERKPLSARSISKAFIGDYRPQIDVAGDSNHYEITLDVPGLKEDDLNIEVKGDVLTIKGKKVETNESNSKQFYRIERSYGSFQRTLSLPDDACADDIRANLKNGVLSLKIPRMETTNKDVKKIPITS